MQVKANKEGMIEQLTSWPPGPGSETLRRFSRLTTMYLTLLVLASSIMTACGTDKISIEHCLDYTDGCVGTRDVSSKDYLICENWFLPEIQILIHNAIPTRRSAQFLCERMVFYFNIDSSRECYLRILFVQNGPPVIEWNNQIYDSNDLHIFLDKLRAARPEINICDMCENYVCHENRTGKQL